MADGNDEKDRLHDALQKKEKAEEDRFFAERDAEALRRIREAHRAASEGEVRELAHDRCPRCGQRLVQVKYHDITVDECAGGHGIWLDHGEFQRLAERERDGWLGRFFNRPRAVPDEY
ncbi:MAG: zf-TFIIB domain-containing protein [Candidatus Binatia bacterium]